MEGCIFCKIVAGEIPSEKVYEDDGVLAFKDLNPQAPTHVLVIPKEHVESVGALTSEHRELAANVLLGVGKVAKALGVEQFRTVANTGAEAGQSVFHLHLHLLAGRPFSWPPG